MIPADLDDISISDIRQLLTERVAEGLRIEYKSAAIGGRDSDKMEFLSDVASFANAAGGDIIYGVSESAGVPTAADGLGTITDADAEILRLNAMILSGIEPRLNVEIKAVHADAGPVIVVRVPRGWFGLHMVRLGGVQRFYGRSNSGKVPLDVQQIRAGFLAGAELAERAHAFRDERVARLMAGELPVHLDELRAVAFHIIPATAFSPNREQVDLRGARRSGLLRPLYPQGADLRYNIDGILARGDATYATLFHSGIFEGVSGALIPEPIPSVAVAESLVDALGRYLQLARILYIQPPFFIYCTVFGVADRTFAVRTPFGGSAYYARRFDRNVLHLPSVLVEDIRTDPAGVLRPMLDGLWRGADCEHCDLYDANGQWNPR